MTSVTWWGHATTTIELAGCRVLTDPVLTSRIVHLSRIAGPLPAPAAREADVAVVSHLHADHLHVPSLLLLPDQVRILAPAGAAGLLRRSTSALADRVEEVEVGDVVDLGGIRVLAVAARHDGRRSVVSRHSGPALGFVLEHAQERVWFAGDTGLFEEMADLGPVDLAVVPVGGWGPTLGDSHLDPAQAAEAVRRVSARDAVPVHYGTFWPTGLRRVWPSGLPTRFAAPGTVFAQELATRCPTVRAHVIGIGETVTVGP